MRKAFAQHMAQLARQYPELIFITGDLGFNALEQLQQEMGKRFINAGVAEQSMVSIAAGMASQGHKVVVYSIAPFIVYRALEQIRNDVAFHKQEVYFVGNGGGYGYGIMGSSHHALSDIATLSSLPDFTCYVPAFKEDVTECLDMMFLYKKPAYLRLGLGKNKAVKASDFRSNERLFAHPDSGLTIVGSGPVINNLLEDDDFAALSKNVDLFSQKVFPVTGIQEELLLSLKKTRKLLVVEEHVQVGGLGAALSLLIHQQGIPLKSFEHKFALNYPDNTYGSQAYHQKQCGLDGKSLVQDIIHLLKK
jgi:transketolase